MLGTALMNADGGWQHVSCKPSLPSSHTPTDTHTHTHTHTQISLYNWVPVAPIDFNGVEPGAVHQQALALTMNWHEAAISTHSHIMVEDSGSRRLGTNHLFWEHKRA
ncbi:unnamed protein product [Arctogadus glacialis]